MLASLSSAILTVYTLWYGFAKVPIKQQVLEIATEDSKNPRDDPNWMRYSLDYADTRRASDAKEKLNERKESALGAHLQQDTEHLVIELNRGC